MPSRELCPEPIGEPGGRSAALPRLMVESLIVSVLGHARTSGGYRPAAFSLTRLYYPKLTIVKTILFGNGDPDLRCCWSAELNLFLVDGKRESAIIVSGLDAQAGAGTDRLLLQEFQQ